MSAEPVSTRYRDGAEWEERAGYSRAARVGRLIAVSGTTAPAVDGAVPGGVYEQTCAALIRVLASIKALGGNTSDVIRTRIMLVPGTDVEAACRAHRELLGEVAPANSVYFVAGLVGPGLLVEVEADAVVDGPEAP